MVTDKTAKQPSKGRCPMCGKSRRGEFRPFCSSHCRDRDFNNWLDGRYTVPVVDIEDDDGELDPQAEH